MTMLVKRNITSARLSQKRSMGARLDSCTSASAMPKKMAKTATWRIWPSATLLAKFSGKMWMRKSFQCVGGGSGGCVPPGVKREPDAGLADVDGEQADDQRERRDDLKVDERLDAHAADALDVAVAGDADDEHGEDERSDDALDEPKEDVGEEAQVCTANFGASKPSSAPATIATNIHAVSERRCRAKAASSTMAMQRRAIPAPCGTDP